MLEINIGHDRPFYCTVRDTKAVQDIKANSFIFKLAYFVVTRNSTTLIPLRNRRDGEKDITPEDKIKN